MSCYESPTIQPGETWSSFHANITVHEIIDGTHADITVLPYQGNADRFIMTEDLSYEYVDVVRPFSLVMPTCIEGTDSEGVCKFITCDIEPEEEEPPDDILGRLKWIIDKIIAVHLLIGTILPNVFDIISFVQSMLIKIDEAKNMIIELGTNFYYELDVLEIWISEKFDVMIDTVTIRITDSIEDIFDALDIINISQLRQIRDEIIVEIQNMAADLSNRIITDVWNYIESQLFEER